VPRLRCNCPLVRVLGLFPTLKSNVHREAFCRTPHRILSRFIESCPVAGALSAPSVVARWAISSTCRSWFLVEVFPPWNSGREAVGRECRDGHRHRVIRRSYGSGASVTLVVRGRACVGGSGRLGGVQGTASRGWLATSSLGVGWVNGSNDAANKSRCRPGARGGSRAGGCLGHWASKAVWRRRSGSGD
jgi:hypothetical protein